MEVGRFALAGPAVSFHPPSSAEIIPNDDVDIPSTPPGHGAGARQQRHGKPTVQPHEQPNGSSTTVAMPGHPSPGLTQASWLVRGSADCALCAGRPSMSVGEAAKSKRSGAIWRRSW